MSPKVSEEYKATVRGEVLQAAEKVFAKKGYHAASMDDIVREAGLSKGAIYAYFDGKEDLFLALEARQARVTLEQALASLPPGASAAQKLERLAEVTFSHQAHLSRDACRLNFEFWTSAPRLRPVHQEVANRYHAMRRVLAGVLREGIKSGEFRGDIDPEALATLLMATVDGLSLHWAAMGFDMDWEVLRRTLSALVQGGLVVHARRTR